MNHRRDRIEDGFGAAGRDGDFGFRIVPAAVEILVLCRDRFAQSGDALHRCVLVAARPHVPGDGLHQFGIAIEVRKALRQVDRAQVGGEARHHREDRGADRGQFRLQPYVYAHIASTPSKYPVAVFFRTAFQGKC